MSQLLFAQKDTTSIKAPINSDKYNPLAPAKAAFYSAIFPGGGQIYNKKYWKAPIVWASLAIPTYYYIDNRNEYNRYRTAFTLRKQGIKDEFINKDGKELMSIQGLENAQKILRKNRDLSLLTGVLLYVLQIVEASVNAHLLQFDTDDSLSLQPMVYPDPLFIESPKVGLTLKYAF
ncbi:DUF5683 domain-containing protein [Tenacibaculum piscium]|uniref:DUF5683 domain-containing protein n=1 Tax=Tenacibaculum piscium TaxID=1458515 RepID=UPI001F39F58E|nr:DUF5683 domain-containing protein [Tenacibaculum piscium]